MRPRLRRRAATALVAALFAAIFGAEELRAAAHLTALPASDDTNIGPGQHVVALVPLVSAFPAAESGRVEVGHVPTDAAYLAAARHAQAGVGVGIRIGVGAGVGGRVGHDSAG